MEFSEYFSCYVTVCAVILYVIYRFLHSKKKLKLPPGPFNLPVVGYLFFLRNKPLEKLRALSEKYGNIFSLHLGMARAVVISDFETFREAFSKSATLDRPPHLFQDLPDQLGLTSINGTEWTEQRKYTMKAMRDLGLGKSEWQNFVQDEVDEFVQLLAKQKGEPFYVKPPLIASIANNMFSLVFGYRLPADHPKTTIIVNAIYKFPRLFNQTGYICMIPGLVKFLKSIGFDLYGSEMKAMTDLNNFIRKEINLKRENMNETNENSYVDGYLKKLKDDETKKETSFNEPYCVGNIQSLLFGGIETTMTTLMWLFLAMCSYPKIQQKVHEEVDNVLGRSCKPLWANRSKFPYTYATILECMRWKTVVPMNLLRWTNEDVKICGYDVPKNTIVVGFLWGVQSNSKTWKDPETFVPERFMDANGDLVTKPDGWVPFSYGKRNCPGETPAMIELFIYFTTIMQKFTILNFDTELEPDLGSSVALILVPNQDTFRFVPRN